jgi:tRNA dimethylallyltransferase
MEARIWLIAGPTASGKSALGQRLAEATGGEIVNADSMQLYRGMDIGTAKPTVAERGGVAHHLLDVWPVTKSAAVAEYQAMARAVIDEVHNRGRLPIVVGGSGLYVRGALDRLDFPGESAPIRARLTAELETVGAPALHERLRRLDPEAAAAVLPSNGRRIVRALEVIELTGGPFVARMPGFESVYDTTYIGLDRNDLDDRIAARVGRMFALGFVDEVRGLLGAGLRGSPTAGKALGYAQILRCLDEPGAVVGDLEQAAEETVQATQRFVRRQRSWFRRDPRIVWLDGASATVVAEAAHTLDR